MLGPPPPPENPIPLMSPHAKTEQAALLCVRVNLINRLSSSFKYSRNNSVSGSKKPAWIDGDVTCTTVESAGITIWLKKIK